MAEAKSDANQPQELQTNPLNQRILRKLNSLSRVVLDNMGLFLDSRQYPPNVISLISKWDAVTTIPTNITYSYRLDLNAEVRAGRITGEMYDAKIATLDGFKKGLDAAVNERMPLVGELVESLIPPMEETKPTQGDPKDKFDEMFNQEETKHRIRTIDFLLDTDVVKWCAVIKKDEFQKFLSIAKEGNLPQCLVSEEEMVRLWDQHRENFSYEWRRMTDLYNASHPESPTDFADLNPKESQSQRAIANPARYTFLDLYQKRGDLDATLKELVDLYPNEKAQNTESI